MIVHVSTNEGDESFAEYVDRLLTTLGETNSSASRKTGVQVSLISKWRLGQTSPTIKNVRKFADGLGVPRLVVMVKAGLLEPEDAQLHPMFMDLAELYAALPNSDERQRFRDHISFLVQGTRDRLIDSQRDTKQSSKSRRRTG